MKQTPIARAIEKTELYIGDATPHTKEWGLLRAIKSELQSLLPYERECIEGAFTAGVIEGIARIKKHG